MSEFRDCALENQSGVARHLEFSARVTRALFGMALCYVALSITAASAQPSTPAPAPPATPPAAQPGAPVVAQASPVPETATGPVVNQQQRESAFDDFFKVGLDLEKPLAVHNLSIRRDTMELGLADGTIYLAQPVAGRITGAYFSGKGTIRAALPNAIDRKLMQGGTYGKPVFEEPISEAVLRFDDGADREILAAGKPGTKGSDDPSGTWNDRMRIAFNSGDLQMDFLDNMLNGLKSTSFFQVDAHTKDGKDWYIFEHNGRYRVEDYILHERAMGAAGKRWYEVDSAFHRPEDYDAKGNYDVMPESDNKEFRALRNVAMTIEIPNLKSLNIDARLTVEAARNGVRALRFDFVNNIDAATWHDPGRQVNTTLVAASDGTPLPYLHRCHELLVLLPAPLAKGEQTVVHVKATENTIVQLTSSSFGVYSTYAWFPQIGFNGGRYTTDWTVKVAKPLLIAGTGDVVREWTEGNLNCGQWKSDVPVQFASFIFGDFQATDGAYKRASPGSGEVGLRLLTGRGRALPGSLTTPGETPGFKVGFEIEEHNFKGNPQAILHNISEGLKTYETVFGPFPFAQLDITEMAPYEGWAQSPAGFIMVSSIDKGGTMLEDLEAGETDNDQVHVKVHRDEQGGLGRVGGGGIGDQFVYHELAHQWWGHQIGWASSEDAWISESWAEYSAGLMIDAIDHKRFVDMRDKWKHYASIADPFGTIATAYRTSTVEHPYEYTFLVYDKGPYVVHMLRTWMGWDKFSKYVNTIQTKYKGTNINTDTLAREASAVMGYDMFPFFDQWVRDKGIPKVHWSWSSAPDTDGKPIVTIKVKQEDQANFKILMIPISLDFGKGDPVVVPKPMVKAEAEIKVKVPAVPRSVKLDADSTQLATFVADGK
jgi:hypothetical protein